MSIHENSDVRVPINEDSVSIKRDNTKCILCGNCRSVCKYVQGVYGRYDLEKTEDYAICIDCGQCTTVCPTGAICEVKDFIKLKEMMKKPGYTFVFQTAPAVRVALGEEFGFAPGTFVQGKLVTALRKLGATYVFDTAYGADVTVMEEASELLERLEMEKKLPMFTSCCPAWVQFVEYFYPEFIPNLSTCKSPIFMEGALIKSYFAEQKNLNPKRIVTVAITPCTAKKQEKRREEKNQERKENQSKDIDFVITTRELASWLKEEKIDFASLEDTKYDSLLGEATGAGLIFGTTGGVMEATLRTVYFYITGEKLPCLEFLPLRGMEGIKEAKVEIGDIELTTAVITGTNHMHPFLELLKTGQKKYDFIEVMACPGGCIAGGGQPKSKDLLSHFENEVRSFSLYREDRKKEKRCSYENLDIQKLYSLYLMKPGSKKAMQLLHTSYTAKDGLLSATGKVGSL